MITAKELVDQQAQDDGLWFHAVTAPEAYLQMHLRKLHAVVEWEARETKKLRAELKDLSLETKKLRAELKDLSLVTVGLIEENKALRRSAVN